jgi:uncharacterized protein YjbI with pentapeptide repeats
MGNEEEEPGVGPGEASEAPRKDTPCSYTGADGDSCDQHALPSSKGDLCIFHAPLEEKDPADCRRAFLERVDGGDFDFEGYVLPDTDLSGKVFHTDVSFRRAIFRGDTSFSGAHFAEHVFFQAATFEGDLDVSGATFSNDVSFEDASLEGNANFDGAAFKAGSYWAKAAFEGEASFKEATFGEEARFEEVAFGPSTDLGHATFLGDAHFDDLRAGGRLYLGFAEFHKYAFFMDAACEGEADFSFAEFGNYADFTRSRWKEMDMTDVIFERRGCFDGAVMEAGTFEDAELRHVTFRDVDLSNVLTTGASLEEAYLSQARWGRPEWGPFGKKVHVREEAMADEGPTVETLRRAEAAHRNLKESYKNEGDYETAGEFFIREMAIKRRTSWRERKYAYWFMGNVISGLCGYGERPTRVIFWWFAFTFSFALVYFAGQLIEYSDGATQIDYTTLGGFLTCMYFSVVTFTTLGFGDISPVTDAGRAVASVEAFTGAFMIALFVLVFGRKMIR